MDKQEYEFYALEIELGRQKSCQSWKQLMETHNEQAKKWYEFKNKPVEQKYFKQS